MSELDLSAIAARAAAATEGPWHRWESIHAEPYVSKAGHNLFGIVATPNFSNEDYGRADAEFIAHARTDIPALLAEVERLAERAELEHQKFLRCLESENRAQDALAKAEALVAEKNAEIERLADVAETNTAAYEYAVVERNEARAALAAAGEDHLATERESAGPRPPRHHHDHRGGVMDTPRDEEARHACSCGHSVWWHHDTRGCGYRGFSPENRCGCDLLAHEALELVIAQAKAEAYEDAANYVSEADYLEGAAYDLRETASRIQPAAPSTETSP